MCEVGRGQFDEMVLGNHCGRCEKVQLWFGGMIHGSYGLHCCRVEWFEVVQHCFGMIHEGCTRDFHCYIGSWGRCSSNEACHRNLGCRRGCRESRCVCKNLRFRDRRGQWELAFGCQVHIRMSTGRSRSNTWLRWNRRCSFVIVRYVCS